MTVSTVGLWWATKKAAERQVRDTEILQRAYISVEPAGISASSSADKCHPNINILNAGNLPARNVRWTIEWATSQDHRRRTFRVDLEKLEGGNTLSPKGGMIQGGPIIYVGNDHGDLRNEPGLYLYIWGAAYYDDGFGNERWTRFCHRYNTINLEDYMAPKREKESITYEAVGKFMQPSHGRVHRFGNDAT